MGVEPVRRENPSGASWFGGSYVAGLFLCVAVVLVALPVAVGRANSYDGMTMERVAVAIADHGTPLVRQVGDQFGLNTPYSGYGIGTSVVMAPLDRLGRLFGGTGEGAMNSADGILIAITVGVVWETLRRRGVPPPTALFTTVVIGFATPLLAYAMTDFSEPGVALMVALIVLSLDALSRGTWFAAAGAGGAVGGALLFRADSLLLIGLPTTVAMLVISRARTRDTVAYSLAVFPAVAITAWYNAARFGSIVKSGYANQGFTHALLPGVYGLTLSPGRGVFVYVPILLVAIVVIPSLRGIDLVLGVFAIALLVGRVLLFARWWAWYGGDVWGPRFLVPVIPAFAPALAVAFQRWQRSAWVEAAVVASAVISLSGVWVTMHPDLNSYLAAPIRSGGGEQFMAQATDPRYVTQTDQTMFDWSLFPFGHGNPH